MARQGLLTITATGTLPITFPKLVDLKFISAKEGNIALGVKAEERIKFHIDETLVREGSTGNLKNSINTFVENAGEVVGVGKISEMNEKAPYWYLVNNGGFSGAARHGKTLFGSFSGNLTGSILPDSRFAGTTQIGGPGKDRWFPGIHNFPMKPKNPIAPKNYIEKTINWLSTVWRIHYSGYLDRTTISSFKR